MKILYFHGLEGKPNGAKAEHLKALGHEVIAPSLPKEDLIESIRIAKKALEECNPDIIVGSSRGGAIAYSLMTTTPKILIAPAFKAYALKGRVGNNDVILHCKNDDVVPYIFSQELADVTGCRLINCGKDHRMSDTDALFHLALYVPILKFSKPTGE